MRVGRSASARVADPCARSARAYPPNGTSRCGGRIDPSWSRLDASPRRRSPRRSEAHVRAPAWRRCCAARSSRSPNDDSAPTGISRRSTCSPPRRSGMNFQDLLLGIQSYWAGQGCVLQQPLDLEVGAGTMHPETRSSGCSGPEPWRVAFCQPSRRPVDGRFGENPMRLYKHYQFQVILKPAPHWEIQQLYLDSLARPSASTPGARHSLRGGQLGVADAGRRGRGLAGRDGRHGDLAVHLLPAGRRAGAVADLGRADLRHRAHLHVPERHPQRLRHPLERPS